MLFGSWLSRYIMLAQMYGFHAFAGRGVDVRESRHACPLLRFFVLFEDSAPRQQPRDILGTKC